MSLQRAMDTAALKPERLLVHLDAFDEMVDVPHGEILDQEQVESGLHESMSEDCWCRPIIIEVADTRTAEEIFADYVAQDVGEILT